MRLCCEQGSTHICGNPGSWDFGNGENILYCPWCGTKLPEKIINKWDCVVRYNRGLGPEFLSLVVEANNKDEAVSRAEKEAAAQLVRSRSGLKWNIMGTQASPIKP